MLIGRDADALRLRQVIDSARAGGSEVLLVRGESGIGKTSLLAHAVACADGMQVLEVRGLESEGELPFAGLHDVLRPVLHLLDEIPTPQAEAVRGALLLEERDAVDRFAVSAGVLSILVAAAEREPLLLVIDDAQWLDAASTDALVFAIRRLGSEGIGVIVGLREGTGSAFFSPGFPELLVEPLETRDAAEIVREVAGSSVRGDIALRIAEACAGNPLALREVTATLEPAQLVGTAPLQDLLPAGRAIEAAFTSRLAGLPEVVQTAVVVAAASEVDVVGPIAAAAKRLGATIDAFTTAEAAGLLEIEAGRLRFTHPLLRSVVYAQAAPKARRAAHTALAEEAADDGSRAWHQAAAAIEPDESIAAALEASAESFVQRGGHLAAARALERAVRITPDQEARAKRLLAAGEAARAAGHAEWAKELLEEARALASDSTLQADIDLRAATLEAWSGSAAAARSRFVDQADRLERIDPERAAAALGYATALALVGGETNLAVEIGRRGFALAPRSPHTSRVVHETLGAALLISGNRTEARQLLREAAAIAEREQAFVAIDYLAACLVWAEEYDLARALLEPLAERSREAGDLRTLSAALKALTELEYRVGQWAQAYALGTESVRLAEETDQAVQRAYSAAVLAQVEAAQGHEVDARRHVADARVVGESHGLTVMAEYAGAALGLLELGLSRPDAAISELESARRCADQAGRDEPAILQWVPDLIEAYVQAGRQPEAESVLTEFERQARRTQDAWSNAAAARCRGLLAGADEIDEGFAEALRTHTRAVAPFERARAELDYGRRLRREGRRVDAREQLRSALARFEGLGAAPWAEMARRELAASGERLRSREGGATDELTAQELQIALTVAKGATNKETAASLFLSPKTVESHLSSVYRKLGVRSRAQMINRLRAVGAAGEAD